MRFNTLLIVPLHLLTIVSATWTVDKIKTCAADGSSCHSIIDQTFDSLDDIAAQVVDLMNLIGGTDFMCHMVKVENNANGKTIGMEPIYGDASIINGDVIYQLAYIAQ